MKFEATIKIDERKVKGLFEQVGIPAKNVVIEYHSHVTNIPDKNTIMSIYFQEEISDERLEAIQELAHKEFSAPYGDSMLITDTYIDYSFDDNLPYVSVHFKYPLEPVFYVTIFGIAYVQKYS